MTTLILSAPWNKKNTAGQRVGKPGGPLSWETYVHGTHIGVGYALYHKEWSKLTEALARGPVKVVLLRNDRQQRRAEARLTALRDTSRATRNWAKRYDVHFDDPVEMPYEYLPEEKLKENGVKVI